MQAQASQLGRNQYRDKPVDRQAVIDTFQKAPQLSHSEIATLNDCDRTTVCKILTDYRIEKAELEEFKSNRADILAGLQLRLTKTITDEEIKKAPLGTRILASCQLYDKERIERGQSIGQDIQINVIQALGDRTKDLRSILDKLASTQDVVDVEHKAIDNGVVPSIEQTQCNDNSNLGEEPSLHNASYTTGDSVTHKEAEAKPRRRGRPAKGR